MESISFLDLWRLVKGGGAFGTVVRVCVCSATWRQDVSVCAREEESAKFMLIFLENQADYLYRFILFIYDQLYI